MSKVDIATRVALQRDLLGLVEFSICGGISRWKFPAIVVRDAGEDRGMGVFAARVLIAGERLIAESPLVHWPNPRASKNAMDVLEGIVSRLDATRTKQFWAFGQSTEVYGESVCVKGTWLTNALPIVYHGQPATQAQGADGVGEAAMFLTVSRFNHSCAPSCHYEWNSQLKQMTVHVLRAVAQGEELTISYLSPSGRIKSERQGLLLKDFGFMCTCAKCALTGSALSQSNARQRAIGDLAPDKDAEGATMTTSRFGAAPQALLDLLRQEELPGIWARTTFFSAMMGSDRPVYWAQRLAECLRLAMGSDHPSVETYASLKTPEAIARRARSTGW